VIKDFKAGDEFQNTSPSRAHQHCPRMSFSFFFLCAQEETFRINATLLDLLSSESFLILLKHA